MNKGIILGIVVLVVVGGIALAMSGNNAEQDAMMEQDSMMKDDAMMKKDEMMQDGDSMEKDAMMKDETSMMKGESSLAGSYEFYAPEKISMAASKDVVLFFKASWCPSCRAVDANIKANLSKIPSDVVILEVDYDNSTELKKKYGVTSQHTFVQVDKDGNLIKKWLGGSTLADVTAEIQ